LDSGGDPFAAVSLTVYVPGAKRPEPEPPSPTAGATTVAPTWRSKRPGSPVGRNALRSVTIAERTFLNVQTTTSAGAALTCTLVPAPDGPADPFSVHAYELR